MDKWKNDQRKELESQQNNNFKPHKCKTYWTKQKNRDEHHYKTGGTTQNDEKMTQTSKRKHIREGQTEWKSHKVKRDGEMKTQFEICICEVERNGKTATYKTVSPTFWRLSHSRQDSDLMDNVIKVE